MALDEIETDGVDWVFRPANPMQPGIRERYRRLRLEMQIIATKAREDLNDIHRDRPWLVNHSRAEDYMHKLLDADKRIYSSSPKSIVYDDDSAEEPCFHMLGITSDFLDSVILDFYALQTKHDEPRTSYYLSSLEAIAKRRNSLKLLTDFQTQKSMGAYTRKDVGEAYMALLNTEGGSPIDPDAGQTYSEEDDETLINIAASMMMDNAPVKHKIRTALEIIGKERDSQEIRKYLNTPERDFVDLDSALRYLGAEEGTDDDFLITLYDIKQDENAQMARSALETIADDRKNVRLKRFLDTGDRSAMPSVSFDWPEPGDIEMLDPDLAYSKLGVDDRSTDDDMLIMLYEIRVADDPGEAPGLKRALELLGDVRNSSVIKSFIATGSKEIVPYVVPEASPEKPVGLENIGNTCYLNSLLQYYFTIQPLRQAILNLEGMIEEGEDQEILQRKKVGGRLVTREEIERAIRFINELRKLFRSLINSSQASLKPSRAVCFLALVSQKDENDHAPPTILSSTSHPASQLEKGGGLMLNSSASNQVVLHNTQSGLLANEEDECSSPKDNSNLLGASVAHGRSPKRKVSLDWAETSYEKSRPRVSSPNLMDVDETLEISPSTVPVAGLSLQATSTAVNSLDSPKAHSNTRVEEEGLSQKPRFIEDSPDLMDSAVNGDIAAPSQDPTATRVETDLIDAPRVPQRGLARRRQSSLLWSETNDWGRQQDVAECIDNVLFQIEAALKPTEHDEDGEQLDLIKDLFYGETKQILDIKDNKPKLERFSNTIVTLETEGQDLYQALDGVFDAREVELGGKEVKMKLTIAKAPPILQVQIQRVGFDLKTMSAVKSNIYLALDQSIYLDRYLDTESEDILQKREDYWLWKKELATTAERKIELQNLLAATEVAGPQHSDHIWSATANEVNSSDEEEEHLHIENVSALTSTEQLRRGSVREIVLDVEEPEVALTKDQLETELRVCEAKERDLSWKTRHLFDEHISHEYRLHSVFIHRGEASHGHYWVYIYDFERDMWRKYNDEEVTDVPKEEIFQDRKGSNENPYMLSYVRADQLHLTSALERDLGKEWEDVSLL